MVKTPTSATSPDRPGRLARSPKPPAQRGFTLIELLVVLTIGALLVALAPSAFDRLQESSQYRATVRALVLELRQARQQALAQGQTVRWHIDLSARQFGLEGQPLKAIPSALEIKATVGSTAVPDPTPLATIAFTPDGGSSGGTIELVRPSGAGVRIRVDWLFGQVTQEPHTP